MKQSLSFVRTTLTGGLLFLVPFVVLMVFAAKALELVQKLIHPLTSHMPDSIVALHLDTVLAIAALLAICFLAGCVAPMVFARRFAKWIEINLLSNLPGYEFLKSIGESVLGGGESAQWQVVLARFDDFLQLGFLIERLENGMVAVFVPGAPNAHSGAVHFMTADRVISLSIAPTATLKCLKRMGVGSGELLAGEHLELHGSSESIESQHAHAVS